MRDFSMSVALCALRAGCAGAMLAGLATTAVAQDNPKWFVPKPAAAPAGATSHERPVRRAAEPRPQMNSEAAVPGDDAQQQQGDQVPQYNLPALAPLPPLPKTAPPPNAVIGVLGVPDVMHASTASVEVQKVIGVRRDKLAADYQKEQQIWRDTQQGLINERGKVSDAVLQSREKALQDKVAEETKQFRARNRIIQEAGQISLAQIERVLVAVIRQVAESRGMNLVLHRQQVALNISAFDITDEVTAQLNTLLPSVVIPPDGQEPTPANTGGALAPPGSEATAPAPVPQAPAKK
jgi:Skp family chaperone for outer membrane proteins